MLLSIGGADSGGCYGVMADLRLWARLGAHGTSALTMVTAQNTRQITALQPLPSELVAAQIEAVLADMPVAGVKTGMLGRVELVELVASFAAAGRLPNLVVDPVLVNRHSEPIFGEDVVSAYRELLVPLAALVTPNRPEAERLGLLEGGPGPVLITDGRRSRLREGSENTTDVGEEGEPAGELHGELVEELIEGRQRRYWPHPRVITINVAGSGDILAAAITFGLARARPLAEAVERAMELVLVGLAASADHHLGAGPGPLDLRGVSGP